MWRVYRRPIVPVRRRWFLVEGWSVGTCGLVALLFWGYLAPISPLAFAEQVSLDDSGDVTEAPPAGWVDPPLVDPPLVDPPLDDLPLRRLNAPQLGAPKLPVQPPVTPSGPPFVSPAGPSMVDPSQVTGRMPEGGASCQPVTIGAGAIGTGAASNSRVVADSSSRLVDGGVSASTPARRQLVSLGPPRITPAAGVQLAAGGPRSASGVSMAGWSEPQRLAVAPAAAREGDPESVRIPVLPLDGTIQAVYQRQPVTTRYLAEPQDLPNYTLPPTSSGPPTSAPPTWSAPAQGPPVLPPGSGIPSGSGVPSGGGSSAAPPTSSPGGVLPPSAGSAGTPSGTLPTYPQPTPIVTGAPFVGQPPCQFDGYQRLMVVPAASSAQGMVPGCAPGSYAAPAAYSTVPQGPGPQGMWSQGAAGPVPGGGASVIMPSSAPQLYSQNNAGWRPLFTLGQENYNVQLGRGIIGQPTVYVTGQPFRNFLRYLFP
jgi:hypothetical protein